MKKFIQVIIQEKSFDDWRSFCIAEDSKGNKWELRGYGRSFIDAAIEIYARFNDDEQDWNIYGHIITDTDTDLNHTQKLEEHVKFLADMMLNKFSPSNFCLNANETKQLKEAYNYVFPPKIKADLNHE